MSEEEVNIQEAAIVGTQAAFYVHKFDGVYSTHGLFKLPFDAFKVANSLDTVAVHPGQLPEDFVGVIVLECTHFDPEYHFIPLWRVVSDD